MNSSYRTRLVEPYTVTAEKLASGEFLKSESPTVRDRKHISFTCDVKDIGDGVIRVGQGYEVTSSSWVEISKVGIWAYTYFSWSDPKKMTVIPQSSLGCNVSDFVTVIIDKDNTEGGTFITVMTAGGMFRRKVEGLSLENGEVFAMAEGCEIYNCKLNWFCDGYADDIWIFGDSYLQYEHETFWPYYLYKDGFNKVLLSGYPGMKTQRGLEDFKLSLKRGTPTFALWCLGMNNKEVAGSGLPEENWLKSTEEFLAICKEKGITPILATIPYCPKVCNEYKNDWVRKSGYRYIDFARAVGSDKDINWYPEMLLSDGAHPRQRGAQALYMQVLVDFPEIMKR